MSRGKVAVGARTYENTVDDDSDDGVLRGDDRCHRHYDATANALIPGTSLPCSVAKKALPHAHRRRNTDLCVPRSAFLEPIGVTREEFYQQRLLLNLSWHCDKRPRTVGGAGNRTVTWTFHTQAPHTPPELQSFSVTNGQLADNDTYEARCSAYEQAYEEYACECCRELERAGAQDPRQPGPCGSCLHAVGWHRCDQDELEERWRAGSLHNGHFDVASTLWALARRLVPLDVLKTKLDEYIAAGHLEADEKEQYAEVFEQMQGVMREKNVYVQPGAVETRAADAEHAPMTEEELRTELEARERLLQRLQEQDGVMTDQWRVYSEIVEGLQNPRKLLRMCIQASAGTGKSFLLETLYLWCVVHGLRVSACAPTGIAAARIHVPRTPVHAYTLHYLVGLNISLESTLDATSLEDEKTARLAKIQVLFSDEMSMTDDATWASMKDQFTAVGARAAAEEEEAQSRGELASWG